MAELQPSERHGVHVLTLSGGGADARTLPAGRRSARAAVRAHAARTCPPTSCSSATSSATRRSTSRSPSRWDVPVVLELHDFYAACERAHLERPSGELCRRARREGEHAHSTALPTTASARERWALRSHLFRHALEQADEPLARRQFVADYFREFPEPAERVCRCNGVDMRRPRLSARRRTDRRLPRRRSRT